MDVYALLTCDVRPTSLFSACTSLSLPPLPLPPPPLPSRSSGSSSSTSRWASSTQAPSSSLRARLSPYAVRALRPTHVHAYPSRHLSFVLRGRVRVARLGARDTTIGTTASMPKEAQPRMRSSYPHQISAVRGDPPHCALGQWRAHWPCSNGALEIPFLPYRGPPYASLPCPALPMQTNTRSVGPSRRLLRSTWWRASAPCWPSASRSRRGTLRRRTRCFGFLTSPVFSSSFRVLHSESRRASLSLSLDSHAPQALWERGPASPSPAKTERFCLFVFDRNNCPEPTKI